MKTIKTTIEKTKINDFIVARPNKFKFSTTTGTVTVTKELNVTGKTKVICKTSKGDVWNGYGMRVVKINPKSISVNVPDFSKEKGFKTVSLGFKSNSGEITVKTVVN